MRKVMKEKPGEMVGGKGPNEGLGSTFKWWSDNGIDHKYNKMMTSMNGLKPSGKETHGGELDNSDHAVEMASSELGGTAKKKKGEEEVGKGLKKSWAKQLAETAASAAKESAFPGLEE